MRARSVLAAAAVALWLDASPAAPQSTPAPGTAARPRLLLFVSVDQMRSDYLDRFASLYTGGLRRVLDQGAFFANARYRHANNETGPGHSVLLSGRDPRSSGIIRNDWYDAVLRRKVNVIEDPVHRAVGGKGVSASPAHFNGFTLGDFLKNGSDGSRVVSVATKDRSAILMGGRRADAAFWLDNAEGRFVTSTYYMKTAPAWLSAWNDTRTSDQFRGKPWTRLLPDEGLYRKLAGEDAVAGEPSDRNTFPHSVRGTPGQTDFYEDLRRTPFADEATLDVALQALEAFGLGRGSATDVFTVGFSATDGVGHTWGPDSQELMDQLLRLDLVLGRLFDAVDAQAGRDAWLFGLSADHGVQPLVERLRQQGKDARRASPRLFTAAVDRLLHERFPGASDLIAHREKVDFYLDLPVLERRGLRRSAVEAAIAEALLSTGLVEHVYTHAELSGDTPLDDPAFELHRRAFFAPRSPHLMTRLKPHVYVSDYASGTGHGTYHDDDRHVPVVFMGPGIKPGRYQAESGPEDIAPTLGALLGLDYPLQDAKRVLSEMFTKHASVGEAQR